VLAALALVEVQSGNAERALPLAREAIDLVNSAGAVLEGESYVRLAYAEALYACGEIAAAKEAIRDARARLLTRAEKLHDPVWRAAFFERVREHVQTLARAQEWLGEPIPGQKNEPTAPTP
jgi:ATP/maltotriose-dependent transcriptional regulator MalT